MNMTRKQVFAALVSRGASRAVVQFSGGNDEGGPDSITLFTREEALGTLPTWPSGRESTAAEKADLELADALSAPVFEEYGTFAGDFDVTGEVIWDAGTQTVQMIRDERSEYEHSEAYL